MGDPVMDIYAKYQKAYDGELQGCCLLLADEIQKAIGGDIVAGFLTWYAGSCRRSHWWVEKDGKVIDPMGDYILSFEDAPGREEAHRDESQFRNILPQYERWRITA